MDANRDVQLIAFGMALVSQKAKTSVEPHTVLDSRLKEAFIALRGTSDDARKAALGQFFHGLGVDVSVGLIEGIVERLKTMALYERVKGAMARGLAFKVRDPTPEQQSRALSELEEIAKDIRETRNGNTKK